MTKISFFGPLKTTKDKWGRFVRICEKWGRFGSYFVDSYWGHNCDIKNQTFDVETCLKFLHQQKFYSIYISHFIYPYLACYLPAIPSHIYTLSTLFLSHISYFTKGLGQLKEGRHLSITQFTTLRLVCRFILWRYMTSKHSASPLTCWPSINILRVLDIFML